MIERFRMLELIQQQKEIYLLYLNEFSKDIYIKIVKLNSDFSVGKNDLYYKHRVIKELLFCFEDIDLNYQTMSGIVEDCYFMYGYNSIEDDVI